MISSRSRSLYNRRGEHINIVPVRRAGSLVYQVSAVLSKRSYYMCNVFQIFEVALVVYWYMYMYILHEKILVTVTY